MPDSADGEDRFGFIVKVCGISQQQALGKGQNIGRKGLFQQLTDVPAESGRGIPPAGGPGGCHGKRILLIGKKKYALAPVIGFLFLAFGGGNAEAKVAGDVQARLQQLLTV